MNIPARILFFVLFTFIVKVVVSQVCYQFQKPGRNWEMYEVSSEVSSYNHNAFGGFMSLRAGIFSAGTGTIRFSYFTYSRIP